MCVLFWFCFYCFDQTSLFEDSAFLMYLVVQQICWCPALTIPTLTIPEHKDTNTCNSLSTWDTYLILGTGQVGAPENWHAGSINQSVVREDKSKLCSIVFPRGPSRMEPQMCSTVTCLLTCLMLAFYSVLSCFSTPWPLSPGTFPINHMDTNPCLRLCFWGNPD